MADDLIASLREWAGRLAQQADPVVVGPGSEHAVAPDRLKPAADEVRRILDALDAVAIVALSIEECAVANDLEYAAAYGTEWDDVLKAVASKLRDAGKEAMNG